MTPNDVNAACWRGPALVVQGKSGGGEFEGWFN